MGTVVSITAGADRLRRQGYVVIDPEVAAQMRETMAAACRVADVIQRMAGYAEPAAVAAVISSAAAIVDSIMRVLALAVDDGARRDA
ncbi:MAG: hypothetical protein AB1816_11155 [Bacillota bacterium]